MPKMMGVETKIQGADFGVLVVLYNQRFATFTASQLADKSSKVFNQEEVSTSLEKLVKRELVTKFESKGKPPRFAVSAKGISEFHPTMGEVCGLIRSSE